MTVEIEGEKERNRRQVKRARIVEAEEKIVIVEKIGEKRRETEAVV
jgi:hypothetical protein